MLNFVKVAWNLSKFVTVGGKFKFQVQDSDLEYLFWRFYKHIELKNNTWNIRHFVDK